MDDSLWTQWLLLKAILLNLPMRLAHAFRDRVLA